MLESPVRTTTPAPLPLDMIDLLGRADTLIAIVCAVPSDVTLPASFDGLIEACDAVRHAPATIRADVLRRAYAAMLDEVLAHESLLIEAVRYLRSEIGD